MRARLALLAPLTLALLPAAAASQGEGGSVAAKPPRPGQYRTTLELVLFEVAGVPEDRWQPAREAFVEGLASGNDFCLAPASSAAEQRRSMVEHLAEAQCRFERFEASGATVSATMSCTREGTGDGKVTLDGRIWSENADLNMALDHDVTGLGPTRIVVHAQSARVGDC